MEYELTWQKKLEFWICDHSHQIHTGIGYMLLCVSLPIIIYGLYTVYLDKGRKRD